MSAWLAAFALTQALEVPLYLALLPLPWRKRLGVALGTSALTHPYVWFVLPPVLLPRVGYTGYVVIAETLVVFVETLVCLGFDVSVRRAALTAFGANALSLSVGWWVL